MKHCSVLYIANRRCTTDVPRHLRQFGLVVHEYLEWPVDEGVMLDSEAVVVHVEAQTAPEIAMRLRAKPRFGRRVLIGLVPPEVTIPERQAALAGGFDEVVNRTADARTLVAHILRALRGRPEYRCRIPRTRAA